MSKDSKTLKVQEKMRLNFLDLKLLNKIERKISS